MADFAFDANFSARVASSLEETDTYEDTVHALVGDRTLLDDGTVIVAEEGLFPALSAASFPAYVVLLVIILIIILFIKKFFRNLQS